MDLRRAAERIGVLDQVLALPMGGEDRRSFEEQPEVRGARGLTRVRPEPLESVVERRVRPERRLDRHRRDHVGRADQRGEPFGGERADREHPLGAVHEREPFLRFQRERRQAGSLERTRRGLGSGVGQDLPRPDQREREVRERREIAGGTERSLLGHGRDHVRVQHRHHQVDELGANTRVPEGEDVGAEEEHRPRLGPGERTAHRRGVRTDDPVLQVRRLRWIDPDVRQGAEAGRDAVHDLAGANRVLDDRASCHDPLPPAGRERHVGARRDRGHVRQRERLPDRDRHGCEGYYPSQAPAFRGRA